jgi:hypothetical protein
MRYEIFRVVAVTNVDWTTTDGVIPICLTSYSYCTPLTRFWLTTEGLEDPEAAAILVRPIEWTPDLRVAFQYDGGDYVGTLQANQARLTIMAARLGVPSLAAIIGDISSL